MMPEKAITNLIIRIAPEEKEAWKEKAKEYYSTSNKKGNLSLMIRTAVNKHIKTLEQTKTNNQTLVDPDLSYNKRLAKMQEEENKRKELAGYDK